MARLHDEIERIALGDLMGEGGVRQAVSAAVDRLKARLPDFALPAADPVEAQADAQKFLEELGERAGGQDILDPPWWMSLGDMLHEGWRVVPPADEDEEEGG